ncbi:MAG TPA: hypothetical protein VF062_12855 [Candidatus Limnocylindrales bacterium]
MTAAKKAAKSTAAKGTAAKGTAAKDKSYEGFSKEEREAMKERAKELKAEARRGAKAADAENDMLAKIAEMPESDRVLGERFHAIVKANAPELWAKLWYGMPAFANADGKIVCFFTPAAKFSERYATFGFSEPANLDEGNMWPTAFAVKKLTAADEKRFAALVKKAVS